MPSPESPHALPLDITALRAEQSSLIQKGGQRTDDEQDRLSVLNGINGILGRLSLTLDDLRLLGNLPLVALQLNALDEIGAAMQQLESVTRKGERFAVGEPGKAVIRTLVWNTLAGMTKNQEFDQGDGI